MDKKVWKRMETKLCMVVRITYERYFPFLCYGMVYSSGCNGLSALMKHGNLILVSVQWRSQNRFSAQQGRGRREFCVAQKIPIPRLTRVKRKRERVTVNITQELFLSKSPLSSSLVEGTEKKIREQENEKGSALCLFLGFFHSYWNCRNCCSFINKINVMWSRAGGSALFL